MFSNFPDWWDGLNTISKLFWIIAFPSTLIFLMQLVMTFIGGDHDHDFSSGGDTHSDFQDGDGLHFFSIKNMVAFFTLFSWAGLACVQGGFGLFITLLIATLCGVVMVIIMTSLFYYISKFSYSGTLDFKNAIGLSGNVYIRIPSKKSGLGKVEIDVQGQIRTLNAMTEDPEIIKSGSLIEVIDLVNENTLLVKRLR